MSTQLSADPLDYFFTVFTATLGCMLLQSGLLAEPSFAEAEALRETNSIEAIEAAEISQDERGALGILPYGETHAGAETQPMAGLLDAVSNQFPLWLSLPTDAAKLGTCKF